MQLDVSPAQAGVQEKLPVLLDLAYARMTLEHYLSLDGNQISFFNCLRNHSIKLILWLRMFPAR